MFYSHNFLRSPFAVRHSSFAIVFTLYALRSTLLITLYYGTILPWNSGTLELWNFGTLEYDAIILNPLTGNLLVFDLPSYCPSSPTGKERKAQSVKRKEMASISLFSA